jgi:hypothetical protein
MPFAISKNCISRTKPFEGTSATIGDGRKATNKHKDLSTFFITQSQWLGEDEIEPKHPAQHFVKFCKNWYEKRGAA